MNKATKLGGFLVVIASALPLLDCARPRHASDETYVLIATNVKIPYWQAAAAGLKQAAGQLQVKAEVIGPDTYNPEAQKREFQRVLKGKPSGIMVSAADPLLIRPEIDTAVAQGIPVITIDSDAPGSKRLVFVGTNNYEAGRLAGQIAAEQLKGAGNVVVFTMLEQMNLRDRLLGYESMFNAHPNIKIVQVIDIRGDPHIAFDKTMELVKQVRPKVDAFVCVEALACAEVAEVLNRQQVKGKTVIAMDTDPRTLGWITNGVIAATVAQKPFTMAAFGLRLLDSLHHNRLPSLETNWGRAHRSLLPKFIDTGATIVDKGNVEEFVRQAQDSTT